MWYAAQISAGDEVDEPVWMNWRWLLHRHNVHVLLRDSTISIFAVLVV